MTTAPSDRIARASRPRIGIAVPTLNSARTLDWTLLALRAQREVDVEIMVADSGSTDGTLDICARWQVPHTFVPRGNMYRAINAALRTLDCPWLTYLNSDDIVYPDSYARLIAAAEAAGAALAYGDCDFIDMEGRFLYGFRAAPLARVRPLLRSGLMPFSQPAVVFRREVFAQLDGFAETERHVSDFGFFLRAAEAGLAYARVPRPSVCGFRLHAAQISHVESGLAREEKQRVLKAVNVAPAPGDALHFWRWRLANAPEYLQRALRTGSVRQR